MKTVLSLLLVEGALQMVFWQHLVVAVKHRALESRVEVHLTVQQFQQILDTLVVLTKDWLEAQQETDRVTMWCQVQVEVLEHPLKDQMGLRVEEVVLYQVVFQEVSRMAECQEALQECQEFVAVLVILQL